jgi:hypothetical protein
MAREEDWADDGGNGRRRGSRRPGWWWRQRHLGLGFWGFCYGFPGAPLSCGPRNEGGGCAGGLAALRPAAEGEVAWEHRGRAGQDGRWVGAHVR